MHPQTPFDWWERTRTHEEHGREAALRAPLMSASEQAKWIDGNRYAELQDKKRGKGKLASRTVRES